MIIRKFKVKRNFELLFLKNLFCVFKKSILSFPKHNAFEMAGYLSFLTFIAIFPCTIFLTKLTIFLNQFFLNFDLKEDLSEILLNSFKNIKDIPLKNLENEIEKILKGPPKSIVWYAIFGLVWTSSATIDSIRVIFNRAYNLEAKKHYILNRLFSVFQFILISIITILILFFFHIVIPFFLKYSEYFHLVDHGTNKEKYIFGNFFYFLRYVANGFFLFLYALWLNFVLPDNQIRKKYSILNLFPGALLTMALWILTSKILKFYFTKFLQFNIIYGSLANIISILLFFYVIFLCLIFGAEFNYFYNKSIKNK